MFERSSYVFTEGAGQVRTDIALVKDDTVETELNLSVLVNVSSAKGTAELGMNYNMLYNRNACTLPMHLFLVSIFLIGIDYKIELSDSTLTQVWFKPGIHRVVLPISIIDDNIPEMLEQFEVYIKTIEDCPSVVIPFGGDHVTVNIEDNDGNTILCIMYTSCQRKHFSASAMM